MAATFTLKLGSLDLSSYLRVNPDDPQPVDPYSPHFVEPAFADTPFSDGQVLISTTVQNREQSWPLFLKDSTQLKPALHALIQSINNAAAQRPLLLEWRDDGAGASTFFDCVFVRFEPNFNFRRSQRGYAAGTLHVFTSGYGHTGTTRVCATAAGTGVFLSVPIASLAGDAPALLQTVITDGGVVPSLGRIVAVAPITDPSYAPRIPAASLTDLQTSATLVGASGADGSQYLALPVSPTGGASGVACKVPLANPTIAGGDNRILAVVKSGIDAGVGMYALDPFGNSMGATAVASMSQSWGLVDLGVCRLPTVGYPTLPKIALYAGAIWASGGAGPLILSSPAGLALNEVLCLPDKNLALVYERGAGGASVLSKDSFPGAGAALVGQNDQGGNSWSRAYNDLATQSYLTENAGYAYNAAGFSFGIPSALDACHLAGILSDSMLISAKPLFYATAGDARLVKESASGVFVEAKLSAAAGSYALGLAAATNAIANPIASLALATLSLNQKYRLLLQLQGPQAFINLTRDDGGPVFIPGSAAFASLGASNAAIAGAGMPGLAIAHASPRGPQVSSWEVDSIPSSNLLPWDSYTLDGVNSDTWRQSSAGVFAGQKLVSVQRGAYPKLSPSTTSIAVLAAAVDQGPANDLISAVISVKERFTYAR